MANSKELFKNITIQTLTNLSLSTQMQGRLRAKILAYIKEDECPIAVCYTLLFVYIDIFLKHIFYLRIFE